MTLRELPRAEWGRLRGVGEIQGVDLGEVAAAVPADSRILVVEDEDGAIVGTWTVMRYVHVEGLWIAPAHRKRGSVARRLVAGMRQVAREWCVRAVLTGCATGEVQQLLERVGGVELPKIFVFPVGGV